MAPNRYQEQLRQQLTFIENSCALYDQGQIFEGIRIATSLRVLFHDKGRSPSLIMQLGAKSVPILSTTDGVPKSHASSGKILFFEGLALHGGPTIRPKLGMTATLIELPTDEWWQQIVIALDAHTQLSREMIVRTAANKDGGAHVDADLPPEYMALVEGVWTDSQTGRVAGHHLLYLRQMGYEVLNSPKLIALTA